MASVGNILLSFACSACLARAGVIVTLIPDPRVPYDAYDSGAAVRVDVFAQLHANSPPSVRLRMVQFDLAGSDSQLEISPILFDPGFEDFISFWDLRGAPACAHDFAACGTNYFIDGSLSGDNVLNITYTGLTTSSSWQVVLSQAAPTPLGSLSVTLPKVPGAFALDVLNAGESDINRGAEFRYGFGTPTDPSVTWTARDGTVTGGRYVFFTGVPEPVTFALLALGASALLRKRGRP